MKQNKLKVGDPVRDRLGREFTVANLSPCGDLIEDGDVTVRNTSGVFMTRKISELTPLLNSDPQHKSATPQQPDQGTVPMAQNTLTRQEAMSDDFQVPNSVKLDGDSSNKEEWRDEEEMLYLLLQAGRGHLFSLGERRMIFEAMQNWATEKVNSLPRDQEIERLSEGFAEKDHDLKVYQEWHKSATEQIKTLEGELAAARGGETPDMETELNFVHSAARSGDFDLGFRTGFLAASRPDGGGWMSEGVRLIAEERQRHATKEGWTPEHDKTHIHGELAKAAACYAVHHTGAKVIDPHNILQKGWPWDDMWWKPSPDKVRNLVKAGSLIVAEIDRLTSPPTEEKTIV